MRNSRVWGEHWVRLTPCVGLLTEQGLASLPSHGFGGCSQLPQMGEEKLFSQDLGEQREGRQSGVAWLFLPLNSDNSVVVSPLSLGLPEL